VPGRAPRQPALCRLGAHKWVPSAKADGGDYRQCTACGKVAESLAQLTTTCASVSWTTALQAAQRVK